MTNQLNFQFIDREIEGALIQQRAMDGYINATALCNAVGKKFSDYSRLDTTKEFLEALSSDAGIPASGLVVTVKGGIPQMQGTWVHPDVAVHLGQWLSPKFAVAVSKWVREWMSGAVKTRLPYHIQRYIANRSEVPHTHFSVLNELTFSLIGPLESSGYTLPENLLPDISEGRMFAKWLRDEKKVDTKSLPTYKHVYADGRMVDARLYPNEWLADFRKHFHEVWLPQRARKYFEEKDPKALEYLPKLLDESSNFPF